MEEGKENEKRGGRRCDEPVRRCMALRKVESKGKSQEKVRKDDRREEWGVPLVLLSYRAGREVRVSARLDASDPKEKQETHRPPACTTSLPSRDRLWFRCLARCNLERTGDEGQR